MLVPSIMIGAHCRECISTPNTSYVLKRDEARMSSTLIANRIVHFCTSLHSKFQIRDWFKLTSAERRLVRSLADVTFSQSRIWNLEWSKGQKCTIISANISRSLWLRLYSGSRVLWTRIMRTAVYSGQRGRDGSPR